MTTEAKYASVGWTASRLARHLELALGEMELTSAQYRLLVQLAHGAEASTALAKKLAVSAPSVTAVVDGLVLRGAVERTHSEEDRRRVSLALTASGRALLKRAETTVSKRFETIAAELQDADLAAQAVGSLDIWAEALDNYRVHRLASQRTDAPAVVAR